MTDSLLSPRYKVDDRVLARDEQQTNFYKAVVRRVKPYNSNQWSYLVHYSGWNARWDRWVGDDDLKEYQEGGCAAEAVPQHNMESAATTTVSTTTPHKQSARSNKTTPRLQPPPSHSMPFTLRRILVDDFERLHRRTPTGEPPRRLVHHLPAKVSVHRLLRKYVQHHPDDAPTMQALLDLLERVRPQLLLYPCEHAQYSCWQASSHPPLSQHQTYPSHWLLRLHVRYPLPLSLLRWMQQHPHECFPIHSYRFVKPDEWTEEEKASVSREST